MSRRAILGLLVALAGCWSAPTLPLPALDGVEPQVRSGIAEHAERVREHPASAEAWGRLGMVLDAHRFLPNAAACYRQARALEPESFAWTYHLAVVSDALDGGIDEVAALFERAAALRDDYPPLHCRWGEALGRRGRKAEARRQFERAVALDPGFAAGHRALGELLLTLDDAAGAREHLERAAALDPDDGTTFAALAQAWLRTGEPERARAAASRTRARLAQPVIPDRMREEVAALNLSSTAAAARARAAMAAGRLEEAIRLYLQADGWNPRSAAVQLGLGTCYLKTGRVDLAEQRFRAAIDLAEDPESHWRLATILLERGAVDEAREHLRRAVSAVHEGDPALLGQLATTLARAGQAEESLALFERATAFGGETASLVNNWGAALLQLGRAEQALERFQRAIALDPAHPEAPRNAALARERLGRTR